MSGHVKRDKDKMQPIQVFVRLRPINQQEREARCISCIEVLNPKELAIKQHHGKKYCFDGVFNHTVKQLTVYERIVQPLIAEVLAGYNCTVFAYGQTGTGKTYTMAGGSACSPDVAWQDDEQAGIIPRALAHLFDELRLIQQEYTVRVSYLELYNEELFDLLSDGQDTNKIRIFEDQRQKGSVIVQGIEEQTVHSKYEVHRILEKGQEKRRTASTLMNDQSSRSHTVFTITVHTRETTVEGEELVKTGKLNLVDLAGSENISRSGAVDRRAREAGNINQSLLNLGRVIKSLVEKSAHIPYRASKLTRLLQDSLGGRTKTSIIATISPSPTSLDETLSTLDYANRARNINNRPEVNQRMSQKALMSQYAEEIDRLRKDLSAARTGSGIYLANENYTRLINDQQLCTEELAEKVTIIRDLEQQLKSAEERKELLAEQWSQLRLSFDETNRELSHYRRRLQEVITEKEEHEHLAETYAQSANTLHEQAQALLDMTKSFTFNEAILRNKVEKLYSFSMANSDAMKNLTNAVGNSCSEMKDDLMKFLHTFFLGYGRLEDSIKKLKTIQEDHYERSMTLPELVDQFKKQIDGEEDKFQVFKQVVVNVCNDYAKGLKEYHEWSVSQLWSYMTEFFNVEKKQHEEQCNKIYDKLDDISSAVSILAQNLTTVFDDVHKELHEEIKKLLEIEKSRAESTDATVDQVKNWYEEMRRVMDSGFEAVQFHLTTAEGLNRDGLQSTQEMNKRLKCAAPIFADHCKAHAECTTNVIVGMKTVIDDSKQMRPTLSFHEKTSKDITMVKKVAKQSTEERLLKISEDIDSYSEEFLQANIEDLRKIQQKLEERLQNIVSADADSYNESKRCTDELEQQLSYYDKSVQEVQSSLCPKLEKCKSSVMNFAEKDMIEIRHGGDTPARSRPNLLSNLKQPSPKDRILSKFRLQKESLEFQNVNGNGSGNGHADQICTPLMPTIDESLGHDGSPPSSNNPSPSPTTSSFENVSEPDSEDHGDSKQ